jgi:hypothetical protein
MLRRIISWIWQVALGFVVVMSGIFSLGREVLFSYLASIGYPVPPSDVLQVFGHLSFAAFILSAGAVLWREHRLVIELRGKLARTGQVFPAIQKLEDLLRHGEDLSRHFKKDLPSRKHVDEWLSEVVTTAKQQELLAYLKPGDIRELQWSLVSETEMLLKSGIADEGNPWISDPERIATYDLLHAHVSRLRQLIDKINFQ